MRDKGVCCESESGKRDESECKRGGCRRDSTENSMGVTDSRDDEHRGEYVRV